MPPCEVLTVVHTEYLHPPLCVWFLLLTPMKVLSRVVVAHLELI